MGAVCVCGLGAVRLVQRSFFLQQNQTPPSHPPPHPSPRALQKNLMPLFQQTRQFFATYKPYSIYRGLVSGGGALHLACWSGYIIRAGSHILDGCAVGPPGW